MCIYYTKFIDVKHKYTYTRIYTVMYFTNFNHGIVQSCNFHGKRHS